MIALTPIILLLAVSQPVYSQLGFLNFQGFGAGAENEGSAKRDNGVSQDPSGNNPTGNDGGNNPFAVIPPGYTSPQVPYPSINRTSYHHSPRWEAAHRKAKAFLADWTNDEKQLLVTGTGWSIGRCVGNTPPVPAKNWPGQCLEDSPLGVRYADYVSAFPAGINVATT